MKKILALMAIASVTLACSSNGITGEYSCERPNGKFGSTLRFKKGGKMFLDLVTQELAERSPDTQKYLNVAGEYEIIDDMIVIKYHNGFQTHTLNKIGDKLTSNTDIFTLCTCISK
ncbi:hypothetical protein [Aquimarina mytili]|uniref:Uncharacterized protein n=1 Tax=Aquimarina mytili TaxID=874423 RepID=A0A936ZU48_9FLAO|nr:hypothetical protein [Aquimarina mytili]MBL0682191.1 hypothetical protein [Aquimarina mytili]